MSYDGNSVMRLSGPIAIIMLANYRGISGNVFPRRLWRQFLAVAHVVSKRPKAKRSTVATTIAMGLLALFCVVLGVGAVSLLRQLLPILQCHLAKPVYNSDSSRCDISPLIVHRM